MRRHHCEIYMQGHQGLSQDFKNVCPKQQFPELLRKIPDLATQLRFKVLLPSTFVT